MCTSPSTSHQSLGLEDISEDEDPHQFPLFIALPEDPRRQSTFSAASLEEHLSISGPSVMLGGLDPMDP
jgi:hypothetical protein